MARPSDTKARIRAAARELFAERGVQRTSLRDIADRLGITKPALYYHFTSREELLRSIVQPLIDDIDAFLDEAEADAPRDRRDLLQTYFDITFRHREVTAMAVRELAALAPLDLGRRVTVWRRRLVALLLAPDPEPDLDARARAIVAIGGLSDCTVEFADVPAERLGPPVVAAAPAALGADATDPATTRA
ncbi:TetR/AcrR family transcriptional regulator [Streptosporangium sp. NPDC050855]|uniref:TetR/AcrR family transcriptional regulator n=1 Tax=Streptosporangium sp. NPDC050855 TaxID=3366194 RepID=UPI00378CF79E